MTVPPRPLKIPATASPGALDRNREAPLNGGGYGDYSDIEDRRRIAAKVRKHARRIHSNVSLNDWAGSDSTKQMECCPGAGQRKETRLNRRGTKGSPWPPAAHRNRCERSRRKAQPLPYHRPFFEKCGLQSLFSFARGMHEGLLDTMTDHQNSKRVITAIFVEQSCIEDSESVAIF